MPDALQVHGPLSRGVFVVVVLVSVAILFAPASDVPSAPPGVDKLVHAGLFAALTVTGRWAGIGAAALVVLLLGYAVASELVQGLTSVQRSASPADALADAVGIALGHLAWRRLTRRYPLGP